MLFLFRGMASVAEFSPDKFACVKDTTCKLNRCEQEERANRDAHGTTNRYEIPESSEGSLLEFDDVLKSVGEFGSWQKALFFLTCTFVIIPTAFQITSVVFVSGTPKFQCTTPDMKCDVDKCCKNCTKYEFIQHYTTISTEYNLICDRAYIAANVDSGFMAGMLVGSFLFGFVSDTFGRRFCMLICSVLMTAFSLGSVYTQSLVLFSILRFATALSMMGFYVVQYVYILEIVGRDYRTMVGLCAFIFWLPGEDGAVLIAYYIREWRTLLLVLSCPPALFIFLCLIVPESPRWLVLQGHVKAACNVLMKFSSSKRSTPTDPNLLRSQLESLHRSETNPHTQSRNFNHSPLDLLRTPRMRKRTLIFWFNWLVSAVVVFGFMFYITDLPGNFYLNMAAMYIGDVPGVLIIWITVQKFGRRIPNFVCMVVGGVFCLIVVAVPANQKRVSTVLALFGRFFVNCSFGLLFLYSSELYPTSIRNLAVGSCSTLARVGSIAAPYVVMLSHLPGLPVTFPMLIYGVLAITAGLLTLWLPESLDSNMCQTTEEVNQAEEYYGFIWMGKRALNPFSRLRSSVVNVDSSVDVPNNQEYPTERSPLIN